MEAKNIGIQTAKPKKTCKDNNCPFHGKLQCRGRIFKCTVLTVRMQKTANVGWERRHFLRKYERYEKRRTKVKAHNPEEINAKVGDLVRIAETRKLSKTKNFIVTEIIGHEDKIEKTELLSAEKSAEKTQTEKTVEKEDKK